MGNNEQNFKKCTKCGITKPLSDFYWRNDSNKYRNECKDCFRSNSRIKRRLWYKENLDKAKEYNKEYYSNPINKIKAKEYSKLWQFENKDKLSEYMRQWRKDNPDKVKEIKLKGKNNPNNVAKDKETQKLWRKNNPEKTKGYDKKRLSIPKYKVSKNFSRLLCTSLNKNKNGQHWESLVNYTLQELMIHLENKFTKGMNWNNYGAWHIDHIIPISLWEFSSYDDREFKQCWSLCNLQPLWAFDNISKGNKFIPITI